jgi:hypothetical protein
MTELGHGVAAAHARGLVHRDLKPENVFLHATADGGWTVKVLDFGVAKQLDARAWEGGASIAVRTDGWGAPEQAILARISPAADVWSLGLIAYFACTGRSFFGDVAMGETVVPASVRARSQGVSARLPQGFDAWFARCVSWDPAHRFADAREALGAARPFLGDAPIVPVSRPRHALWGLALCLLAGILLGAGWLLGHHTRPGDAEVPVGPTDPAAAIAHAWLRAVTTRALPPGDATALYAATVRINGDRRVASPAQMSQHWTALFATSGWRFEPEPGAELHLSIPPVLTPGNADHVTCGGGPLRRATVRMHQREPGRARRSAGKLPCEEVRATYRLLLRESAAGWRICSESFLQAELCVSCPTAVGCDAGAR